MEKLKAVVAQQKQDLGIHNREDFIRHLVAKNEAVNKAIRVRTLKNDQKFLQKSRAQMLMSLVAPEDIEHIVTLGLDDVFNNGPTSSLVDAIYSFATINFYKKRDQINDTDHSQFLMYVLEFFAANRLDEVKKIWPERSGRSVKGSSVFVCATNLVQTLLYPTSLDTQNNQIEVDSFLVSKASPFDKALIFFLNALIENSEPDAVNSFKTLGLHYAKQRWIHDFKSPVSKLFRLYMHALWSLSFFTRGLNLAQNIASTGSEYLFKPLVNFNLKNNFPPSTAWITFEETIAFMQDIYHIEGINE